MKQTEDVTSLPALWLYKGYLFCFTGFLDSQAYRREVKIQFNVNIVIIYIFVHFLTTCTCDFYAYIVQK